MKIKKYIRVIALTLCMGLLFSMTANMKAEAKVTKKTLFESYEKYIKNPGDYGDKKVKYKYFALVDANKDGNPELILIRKRKTSKVDGKYDYVSYYIKSGKPRKVVSNDWYSSDFYYNKNKKGIHEYAGYQFCDNVEKDKNGKYMCSHYIALTEFDGKYYMTDWNKINDEDDIEKEFKKEVSYDEIKKWAFTKKTAGTKKVKFFKVNAANLNKLKAGKIAIQK